MASRELARLILDDWSGKLPAAGLGSRSHGDGQMAYDEGLAERIRGVLEEVPGVSEKRMFGGVAFLVRRHMSVGIVQDKLMVRVGPESYDRVLRERHARRMDFTGRPMKGFVYVVPAGYESDADLRRWVHLGVTHVSSLPDKPKTSKGAPPKKRTRPKRR